MKNIVALICIATVTLCSATAIADDEAGDTTPAAACISGDPNISDSSHWATTAVVLFSENQYADAVATVDACFAQWGPKGGHQQKALHDEGAKCPRTGKVSKRTKTKIDANGLFNDVALALWAKARSLHELGDLEAAKKAYGQCIYMTCGRAWDPNGWFWSPAEDCAKQVQELLDSSDQGKEPA
ncbi:MAG TPA: hypothetical protein VLA06_08495 [Woeseiaceae bacterium]|nr:hypothetical protein [Woeseiaceae bacterium]